MKAPRKPRVRKPKPVVKLATVLPFERARSPWDKMTDAYFKAEKLFNASAPDALTAIEAAVEVMDALLNEDLHRFDRMRLEQWYINARNIRATLRVARDFANPGAVTLAPVVDLAAERARREFREMLRWEPGRGQPVPSPRA